LLNAESPWPPAMGRVFYREKFACNVYKSPMLGEHGLSSCAA